jgi:hypothetical protein
MKAAHFPLLRSSPAVGTESYGALRSSHQGSGASSLRTSGEEEEISGERVTTGLDATADYRTRLRRQSSKTAEDAADGEGLLDGADNDGDEAVVVDFDSGEDSEEEGFFGNGNDPFDNSPYPEVRASVLATDDLSMSINTPRMWTLSLLFTLVGSSTNLFFSLRYPSISITPVIALLLAHPLGKIWDQIFPGGGEVEVAEGASLAKGIGGKRRRLALWLGQGRWNQKEHACVYISSNVSFGFAFATDVRIYRGEFCGGC